MPEGRAGAGSGGPARTGVTVSVHHDRDSEAVTARNPMLDGLVGRGQRPP